MFGPIDRERLHQRGKRRLRTKLPIQDSIDELRGEQRQPQDAGEIGRRYLLAGSKVAKSSELASIKLFLPTERAGEPLDQRVVDMPMLHEGSVGQDHLLAATALADAACG